MIGLLPILGVERFSTRILIDGEPFDMILADEDLEELIEELQDSAYTYTEADVVVYENGVTIDEDVTVVVIDYGLSSEEWKALEQNLEANVDVIGFVTENSTGLVTYITDPDHPYLDDQVYHGHGMYVISVLASIARNVEVIFVDLDYANDPYGFEYGENKIWEWIYDNHASKDIDIVIWSSSTDDDFAGSIAKIYFDLLIDNGVILLTSAGNNNGTYLNNLDDDDYMYPQYYTEWYTVGSIDHETRTTGTPPLSTKDNRSSFSSYLENYTSGNRIVNWLSPGNGVPVLTSAYYNDTLEVYTGHWMYSYGTSFSTPYLAGIVALIITGYHNGIGDSTDPSVQKVVEILNYASSRRSFDQKMGYGYIDVYMAYGKAYTEGGLAA